MHRFVSSLMVAWMLGGCGCSETSIVGGSMTSSDATPDAVLDASSEHGAGDGPVSTTCGNGTIEGTEQCDDGNSDDCDGCSNECRWSMSMRIDNGWNGAVVHRGIAPCLPTPFTVEMWFKWSEGQCAIVQQPACFNLSAGISGFLYELWEESGDLIAGGTHMEEELETGTWHHAAITYEPEPERPECYRTSEYMDGINLGGGVGTCPGRTWRCIGPLYIGVPFYESSPPSTCSMTVDEVRISEGVVYTSDFSPTERLSVRSDTIALWTFDEEVDGVIPDVSGNGHDAVLVNGTLVPDECRRP